MFLKIIHNFFLLFSMPPFLKVQRFMAQLTNQCIALSGKRFYYVTRKSLFGVSSTIFNMISDFITSPYK